MMVFSGGIPVLFGLSAVMTRVSPEVTAFTFPFNHPADAAIKTNNQRQKLSSFFSMHWLRLSEGFIEGQGGL